MAKKTYANPFRAGAGHRPPYLAGREHEKDEFRKLLTQDVVTDNLVLTGLRGVGKTVLLDVFKPIAIDQGWLWVGTDLSESASLTEDNICLRMLADLAVVTSSIELPESDRKAFGFEKPAASTLSFDRLIEIFRSTPGLAADKVKAVLETTWSVLQSTKHVGIVFAYDEAQNLSDHAEAQQYPLSLLLDVFQSIQKKGIRFFLALTGLPTLFPKLVEARTFAERMFHVMFLDRLGEDASKEAIKRPIKEAGCPISLSNNLIESVVDESGGYPYFIQFICREVYDVALQKHDEGLPLHVSIPDITRKLDADFFAGRWSRVTVRQRDLLVIIASLPNCDEEFTVQEVVAASDSTESPFSPSHVNQMLSKLSGSGLTYKNRHGRYAFAVPLLGRFIRRQQVA